MHHNNNPYSQATDAYGKRSSAAPDDQRSLEGQTLMKAALKLEFLQKRLKEEPNNISLEDMDEVLDYNRKLWTVFAGETINEEHDLPQDLRNNIASLSVFIFKRTIDIQTEPAPEKINVLIEINRQIAAGLLKQPSDANAQASEPSDTPAQKTSMDQNKATEPQKDETPQKDFEETMA